jgi:putative transposase
MDHMKLTVQIQLLPDAEQAKTLRAIVERFNEACNWIAGECFARQESNQFNVRKFCYKEVRERFGLSSQMAQLAIKAVCDVYKRDKSKRPKFRKHAAIVYDQRTMSFKGIDRVSLLALAGRVLIPFVMGKYQAEQFAHAKGQADLVLRHDGKWFLLVTVDVPEAAPIPTTDFMGVDFGVVGTRRVIATTEDDDKSSGEKIDATRRRYGKRRRSLGKAAGAKRRQGESPL